MSAIRHLVAPVVALSAVMLLIGCAPRYDRAPVAAGATLASEGQGRLTYTAPADGEIQIYDQRRDQLVYTTRVKEGESVVIDPDRDSIMVEGRPVMEPRLRRGSVHQIYFKVDEEARVVRDVEIEVREKPERQVIRERESEPRQIIEREREIEIERVD